MIGNGAFVWTGTNSNLDAVADGLNRDAGIVSINGATLQYDPLGRLIQVTADGATTQFLYAGDKLVAEYDGAGGLLRRYAPSYGVDEAIVWWEGSDFLNPRTLHADRQGSVIASVADSATTIYTYGPYGEPGDRWAVGSRFRYTGQIALPELRLYHYKARAYDPERGWFLQTDPIGYKADLNLYAYVDGDPLNATDPTGENPLLLALVRKKAQDVAIGVLVGGLVGAGSEALAQKIEHGRITDPRAA
ncbi:MAG: RHS repeat-associated core domain-containing protein [Caulobacter sp.]|nr:RHS repeat-associated core domain-containing protein [Caulobacter sp.]